MTNGAKLGTNWRYRGFEIVVLENALLRVDVVPELGGRIHNFVYKPFDRNLLWHNPRIELRKVPLGANFNDNYAGGGRSSSPTMPLGIFRMNHYPITERCGARRGTVRFWTEVRNRFPSGSAAMAASHKPSWRRL